MTISVPEISVEQFSSLRDDRSDVILIDVREQNEWDAGHIAGAVHIPLKTLAEKIEAFVSDRNAIVVCQCAAGRRSLAAGAILRQMGYADVSSLAGGIKEWIAKGRPIESPQGDFTAEQRVRYDRHLRIPEVGAAVGAWVPPPRCIWPPPASARSVSSTTTR